jgi:hypothetical protein
MEMGMNAVLTMNGLLRKEGAGKLSMGGKVMFLGGNSLPGDEPRANSNLFEIVEGTVEVDKATALDGLETTFHAGTRLLLRVDRDDADLTARGIVNFKSNKPFSLSGTFEGDKMPVAFVFAENDAPVIGEELALITVNASAADSVEALLPATVRTGVRGVVAEVFRREPNEDSTVTFAARIRRYGFRFVVR